MKDIMQKLSELEATAPKVSKKKMLSEDSTTPPMNVSNKPASLKDVFESIAGQKPIPVVGKEGGQQQTGAGFVNVTDPALQGLGKTIGDLAAQKKIQLVVPTQPGQPGQTQQTGTTPAPAGATGQPQAGQMQMKEKWAGDTKLNPAKKGMFKGKTKAELEKQLAALHKSGPHKKGSPEYTKQQELNFAIRAKSGWGKVQEEAEQVDEISQKTRDEYIDSAAKDLKYHRGVEIGTRPAFYRDTTVHRKEADKRIKGLKAAYKQSGKSIPNDTERYFKEEQLDELSPDLLNRAGAEAKRRQNAAATAPVSKDALPNYVSVEINGFPDKINSTSQAQKLIDRGDLTPDTYIIVVSADGRKRILAKDYPEFKKLFDPQNPASKFWGMKADKFAAGASQAKQRDAGKDQYANMSGPQKRQFDALKASGQLEEGAKVDRMVKHIEKSERKLGKSKDEAENIAWATANKRGMLDNKNKKKVKEGDIAPTSGIDTQGAGLGAGRSQTTLEGKKPDFLDLDKDGNKKESMKKAAADKKKKKVDESMNHRISAARLEGKSHGLRGHAHSGKRYEDLEELKAYHEGYKEGLDECYGQGVYEAAPAATVPGMADQEMEEGNAFTAALAKTPKGGKFSVGGKTFTDHSNLEEDPMFESWDNQLKALVNEGLSVSVSKGQQNSPDSVTITAQDAEADQLLQLVKSAGLGLFGGDDHHEPSSAMSIQPAHGAPDEVGAGGVDVEVVDGHDGIMGLMQKLSGIQADGANDADYADEEDHKDCGCSGDCECNEKADEAMCNECGTYEGMHEAGCSMGKGKEMVDEVESEDQMEFEVAEDNAPDSGAEDSVADEDAEAAEDAALAKSDMQNKTNTVNEDGDEASEEGPESKEGETDEEGETVSESFINLFKKLEMIAEESTEKKDEKAEKAGKKVAKDIEYDEGHKGKDDNKAEKAGKKVTKDIEYDDKKDKKEKVDEWANQVGTGPGKGTDASFEQDIDFMTKVIAGGLNKPKSTGQTTIPVIAGQEDRMHDSPKDWATLAGIKK